jgi:hypothetical protein
VDAGPILLEIMAKDKHQESIIVKGARTHNLKNINVEMPRNKMVVITGMSVRLAVNEPVPKEPEVEARVP